MANFRTKARAIDLLGKNQIADLPTAITELWKNGYDAYGDYLAARLYHGGYGDVQDDIFLISDDGRGMDENDILNNWIVIGTGNKREYNGGLSEEDRLYKKERVPLGEKGIGRLSVAYLGNHMLMFSKRTDSDTQILFMNWKILDNYEMYLDEVEIPLTHLETLDSLDEAYAELENEFRKNFESKSWEKFEGVKESVLNDLISYHRIPETIKEAVKGHFETFKHGTIFVVFDPISELRELEMENSPEIVLAEDREKFAEQTNYIRSALSGLFNPFDKKLVAEREADLKKSWNETEEDSPCFMIYSNDDTGENVHDFLQLKESFSEAEFQACEHWIMGIFALDGSFTGKIKAYNDEILEYQFVPRNKLRTKIGRMDLKVAFWEAQKKNSIMSGDNWEVYEKKAENYGGLAIYRDGFRVLPYGRVDFDFLGFEENRSKGAGYYYFSHRKMFGYIGISKKENPKLIDKSGREGLISNEAYRSMRGLLKDFFKEVGVKCFGTASEGRKKFTDELQKRKQKEELIEKEKQRNRKQLMELNKRLKTQQKELDTLEKEIKNLKVQLDEKLKKEQIVKSEERRLLSEINSLQLKVISVKTMLDPDISFEGNESIQSLYYSYEDQRKKMINELAELNNIVMNNVYKNGLAEEYTEKYKEISGEIGQTFEVCKKQLDDIIYQIRLNVNQKIDELENILKNLSPEAINLEELSEENTRICISNLNSQYGEILDICNQYLMNYFKALSSQEPGGQGLSLLEAYKSKEIELSNRVDMFYELAQVGLSIDVIDHQFNVLYSEISKKLQNFVYEARGNQKLEEICQSIKMSFQHMEANHKMLMPLYRNTRRVRKNISGEDIKNTLLDFYGKAMDKSDISFECTDTFCKQIYYTFESMLLPVFINIVNNAIYWVGFVEKKIIKIDVFHNKTLIMNSGPQMSHAEQERCFDIFYTKKPNGRGIGLFLAKRNLNAIDFDIYATNDQELNQLHGSCFVITSLHGDE